MTDTNVAVIGAGSWGTALAKQLADQGHRVSFWSRTAAHAEAIEADRSNEKYLPGFSLPPTLTATSDLEGALYAKDLVVWVVPSHGVREVLDRARSALPPGAAHCAAIKGIENGTLALVSQIFEERFPPEQRDAVTFLGGPSFAREVAAKTPTAVCVGGKSEEATVRVQEAFNTDSFRVYTTEDVVGVELGGALKNVVAIAAGASDGLGFGSNTRAALITRGLHEISRLAVKLGANPLTIAGLGGMGDLVLTCTGSLSRNRTVGLKLGEGKQLEQILAEMNMVAEGVKTAKSASELATREGVDMPIVSEVYRVLYEQKSPRQAVIDLMTRPLKHERH